MKPGELSIDELIAAGAELGDRVGVFDQLARITPRARGEAGMEVEVNLDGMIIGLDLTHEALRLGADALAEEIFRLTHQAAAAALAAGVAILTPVAGDDLMSLIDLGGPEPVAVPLPAPAEEDYAAVRSWAV
ncbi:MAG: hypothetical protein ACJ72N_04980 [Labedaea sp.]